MKRGMPFFDRFWWLRSLWLVALTATLIWLLWLGIEGLQQPSQLDGVTTLLYMAICAVISGSLWWTWWQMRKARSRMRARMAAIEGNQNAVPLARFAVEASDAPDIVAAPLAVEYPPSRWRTPLWSRLRVAAGVLWIPYLGLVIWICLWTFSPWYPARDRVVVRLCILLSGLVLLLIGVGLTSQSDLRRYFVLAYRSGRRLTASLEGIECVPVLGRTRLMRWDEARLLEVSRFEDGTARTGSRVERRRYTLYGTTTTLWWNDWGDAYDKPSGDGAKLLALIRARTRLVPRSFDAELREDTRRIRPAARPAPPLPVLMPQLPAGESTRVPAEPEQVYTLVTYVTTNRARAIAGAIGVLLCLGGAVAVVWLLTMLQLVRTPEPIMWLIGWLNAGWASLLGVSVLLGCLLVVAALRKRGRMTIWADGLGLRMARPGNNVLLPWHDVAKITYTLVRNTSIYVVHGRKATHVAWPASVPSGLRAEAEQGTIAVTPDELAAVVAARSGKPVEARRLC